MLTVKQTADLLSVSPGLVYALCARGLIQHERFGIGRGTIRIPEEALVAYRANVQSSRLPLMRPPHAQAFKELNSSRLASAWQKQGLPIHHAT